MQSKQWRLSVFVCLQVYSVLSYSSLHSLDQSGRASIDSSHLHLLRLITVAHLVQILLTTTTGDTHIHTGKKQLTHMSLTWVSTVCLSPVCILPATLSDVCLTCSFLTCLSLEELGMDQDSEASEEEELTCQLYSALRQHLGRCVLWLRSGVCGQMSAACVTKYLLVCLHWSVCCLKCPRGGGSAGVGLKLASCRSSGPLPFSFTTWTPQHHLLICWVNNN